LFDAIFKNGVMMTIKDIISRVIRQFARLHAAKSTARDEFPAREQPRTTDGRWEPLQIDLDAIQRMRSDGLSFREIARRFGVAPGTVIARCRDLDPKSSPEPVAAPRTALDKSTAILPLPNLLSVPRATQTPSEPISKPAPTMEPPMPPIYGLESIPEGITDLFLVRGELNCAYCKGYKPFVQAVGVDIWDSRLGQLPVFQDAERVWIVITRDSENPPNLNAEFLNSIRRDPEFAARCLVSNADVRHVAKEHYWDLRNAGAALSLQKPMLDELTERVFDFRLLSRLDTTDIAALCDWHPQDVPTDYSWQPDWMLGGSSGSQ
jgi:hypothetical protein